MGPPYGPLRPGPRGADDPHPSYDGARRPSGRMGGLQMSVGVTVSFDPFEPGFDVWPYDQYGRLRDADPAGWSDLLSGWLLTRYDDVARLLRDPSLSSDLDRANPSPVVDVLRARAQ